MSRSRTALAVVGVTAAFAFTAPPATAGTTGVINDAPGVDYDAACVKDTSSSPPSANSISSGPGAAGCQGVTTYDGSTTSTDLTSVSLQSTTTNGLSLKGTWTVAGSLPAPGSTVFGALDMPGVAASGVDAGLGSTSRSGGVAYVLMFQNKIRETSGDAGGGCTLPTGRHAGDVHGSWKDGYHFFLLYEVDWDGTRWVHTAAVGEYDPSGDGGFSIVPLGIDSGNGWANESYTPWSVSAPAGTAPATITLEVAGDVLVPDSTCAGGAFRSVYARAGDVIGNVKGVTMVHDAVSTQAYLAAGYGFEYPDPSPFGPPNTAVSNCSWHSGGKRRCWVYAAQRVTQSVSSYAISDVTDGNSTAGLLNTNISGIAYSRGAAPVPDTLANGPTCPTSTYGGSLPTNPLWTNDTACQLDDDNVSRGSVTPEFWDTVHGFTA
jgi:hypothetical protein